MLDLADDAARHGWIDVGHRHTEHKRPTLPETQGHAHCLTDHPCENLQLKSRDQ